MAKSSLLDTFISTRMMATLLLIFAISIGAATFVEDRWDTEGAQRLIYHSWWFKTVMILLIVNFIGNIKRYQLLQLKKWSILLVHLGLIITLIGAGITHYIGFEGIIRVKEGEIVGQMWTSDPYFEVNIINEESGQMYKHPIPLKLTELHIPFVLSNDFEFEINPFNKGVTSFEYVDFLKSRTLGEPVDNAADGINTIELVFAGESEYLTEGGFLDLGDQIITFNNPQPDAINITGKDEFLEIEFPMDITRLSMLKIPQNADKSAIKPEDILAATDTLTLGKHPFLQKHLHNIPGGISMVYKDFHYKLSRPIIPAENGQDILKIKVTHNGESRIFNLWGGKGSIVQPEPYVVGGQTIYMRFGPVEMDLPFSLRLDDFILGTYEGSDRHSSYRSEVSIYPKGADPMTSGEQHSIYMNHVLDYEGYRVFQSSYDKIGNVELSQFSVNHDFWGTTVTYIGYLLLSIGFIFSLFNRSSRFVELGKKLAKSNVKTAVVTGIILSASTGYSQNYQSLSQDHCDKFNELLVVSYTGRIEPCNSLAFDLIRKLSRKDYWTIEETNEKLSPEQFMLDLFVDPGYWANQRVIKFKGQTGVGKDLGVDGNFLAFTDIVEIISEGDKQFLQPKRFEIEHNGKKTNATFDSLVNWAESKPMSERNVYDKEVLKINEKIGIIWQAMQGHLLKIIPVKIETEVEWVSWFDDAANFDFSQGNFEEGKELTGVMFIRTYLNALIEGKSSGNYENADKMLEIIKVIQRKVYESNPDAIPSESMISLEIQYNKLNLFNRLKYYYLLFGFVLLILTIIAELRENSSKLLNFMINVLVGLVIVSFIAHTANLALRWYIIGHAPWSDGYEALTTIAWGTILSGLIFTRYSKIVTGAAAMMAFFVLMTAGHSQYDPQMSDLEPVLKSYWLNIHVLFITVSYSFFGKGFILSLINLGIMAFRKDSNLKRTDSTINKLSNIIEMTLTIGLVLATIGTFLGGIWANESWGRYWGWDAKETWALVIVLVYAFVLHMRFVPGLRGKFMLNIITAISFSTVIMTFVGVNYYLTKGLHSYARGDAPAFAWWVWAIIAGLLLLFTLAGIRENKLKNQSK
ncbi:MAG: cytochrome c biogenesis protein CcsA [Flavobacteriales bacterium]|nr:cytochrome c biogenesis protein CcsA [Flavobacteriales bacterium]